MHDETLSLHAGYTPGNTEPRVLPIVQSTTYTFDSAAEIAKVFDDPTRALIYSRFANPTVMAVEQKVAELEGGVAAMATSSGQAATLLAVLNLCSAGDSLVTSAEIYGGTYNLFAVTLKRFGIEAIFVDPSASAAEISSKIKPNTRLVFGETLSNPSLNVLDIEKFAQVAHAHGLPLIVDNTFPTPILCKPFNFGADIVIHSTTKYMDGHALQVGGIIVDSGKFNWANGKFPEFTEPDDSYHGINYVAAYGEAAYILRARMQLQRDFGAYPAAHSAFLLNLGLETLPLRMRQHSENAQQVAEFLATHPAVASVKYPGLPGPQADLVKKYLQAGSGVISFTLNGGREAGMNFMDSLQLVSREVHVADIRSCVLHPASTTHRQLSDAQLASAGIAPGLVRLSVGLENVADILADIQQALPA
ncbi:MAG: O-acetylhomoserine aminocarboxypropyltransferase/cysteine synthase [Trueperella sp.]|nr:O-acetylhomoserine aminocarboxypropyltransferase/cysteine synthase [Trueperella sp.]